MANSLYPGFVLFNYHSAWGAHKMTLPTRAWQAANISGVLGSYTAWDATQIDAESMIDALVAKLKAFWLATAEIDDVTVYTLASPTAPAIPVAGKAVGVVGTSVDSTQAKAAEIHWTFRDTGYAISGLSMLDAPVGTGFEPVTSVVGHAAVVALIAEWTATFNAWSSRAGARPSVFRKITYKLNDALRKRYGMA